MKVCEVRAYSWSCGRQGDARYVRCYLNGVTDLFPHVQHFQVAPQFEGPFTPGSVDFTIIYIVTKRKVPVFFIKVKPYADHNCQSVEPV